MWLTNYRLGRTVIKEKILEEAVPKYLTISLKQSKNNEKKPSAMAAAKDSRVSRGVESLTQKTSHLDITHDGARKSTNASEKPSLARKQQLSKESRMEDDSCEVRRSPRLLAKKRVRSVIDEVCLITTQRGRLVDIRMHFLGRG